MPRLTSVRAIAIAEQQEVLAEGALLPSQTGTESAPPAPRAALRHIPALDGLRGVAIILVCFYHFCHLPMAWGGVDLFFVLSGFLITRILVAERNCPHYFRNFYVHRALRILPLYYLFVAVFFNVVLPIAHRRGVWLDSPSQLWYWSHLSNWSSAFGAMIISPIGHFWSLAIEEQFYLVWPFLVLLVSEKRLRSVCVAIICLALAGRGAIYLSGAWRTYPELVYRLTPFRIDSIAFGALLATLKTRLNSWWFCIAGLLFVVPALCFTYAYQLPAMFTFGFTGVGLLCFAAVLAAIQSDPFFLHDPVLRSFGKYSYAIYLVQVPIYFVLAWLLDKAHITTFAMRSVFFILLGFPLAYGFAWISWRVVEKPFLNLKRYF